MEEPVYLVYFENRVHKRLSSSVLERHQKMQIEYNKLGSLRDKKSDEIRKKIENTPEKMEDYIMEYESFVKSLCPTLDIFLDYDKKSLLPNLCVKIIKIKKLTGN